MEYRELFSSYVETPISAPTVVSQLKKNIEFLQNRGQITDAAKAQICIIYFLRLSQYNNGVISRDDFLLFLRDFVLYLGQLKLPDFVQCIIRESGEQYGLHVSTEGIVSATFSIPAWLGPKTAVYSVYSLSPNYRNACQIVTGDQLISKHSVFTQYRSIEQKIAIHAAAELPPDYTMMVSLPTGGGKSLVTQVLTSAGSGLTLVIVPTVALAIDQFLQAEKCIRPEDIVNHVFYYKSDMEPIKVGRIISEIRAGTARMLITSPEAVLKNPGLNNALREAAERKELCNVIVDEAHIVPDWGVLFRPDFQIFSVVLQELRELSQHTIRTYLLSATLSENTVDTLFQLFGQDGKNVAYRCDTLRAEPRFLFSECHNFQERRNRVIELALSLPKPLIIYVLEPKEAKWYKKEFSQRGFKNIDTFTGETPDKKREDLLTRWKNDELDIIVATSAFGMGVDKSNVRTIVHACVPESVNRFYQEVGRAGRDGLPSLSALVPYRGKDNTQSDLQAAFGLVSKSILGVDKLITRWYSMLHSPNTIITGEEATIDLKTVPDTFSEEEAALAGHQNMTWNVNALLLLHRKNYITIKTAQYIADSGTYYFTMKLNDLDLLLDEEQLRASLEPDRAQEQKIRLSGYREMTDIIQHPTSKCWGKRLIRLFPFATEVCSCCPIHPNGYEYDDDIIKIREDFSLSFFPAKASSALKKYMGSYHDLLVSAENESLSSVDDLIHCCDRLNLGCVVLPDARNVTTSSNCMVLSAEEFISIAPKAAWLFSKGVLLLLGEDNGINNRLFTITHENDFSNILKVLVGKCDMMILSEMRPLCEFLNANQITLSRLMKE